MENNNSERIGYLDFLKVIGLIGIMIAHVEAPGWALMARAFDVPLMVLIASMLARKSYEKRLNAGKGAGSYIVSRVLRLAVPTWFFLIYYFGFFALATMHLYPLRYYLYSFSFSLYGIAYVWVILVYIYSAVCTPLFHKIKAGPVVCILIAASYVIYEIMYHFCVLTDKRLFENTFYYFIPYAALSFIGYNYPAMKDGIKKTVAAVSGTVFFICVFYYRFTTGEFQRVSVATFPPRIYYLSFGLFVSFVLLIVCEKFDFKFFKAKPIAFVSKHSLWIYLWHIFALFISMRTGLSRYWYVDVTAVFIMACLVTWVQTMAVKAIRKNSKAKILDYLE